MNGLPDRNQKLALRALTFDPNFAAVLEWIKARQLHHLNASMNIKDETLMRWSQGAGQELDELLRLVAVKD